MKVWPVNLLQRLKIETAPAHDRIERAFDLQSRTQSLSAYRDVLARLYGYHAVWEPRAEAALADAEVFRRRRKTELLAKDLRALGMSNADIGALDLCHSVLPMATPVEVFGSMYVIEGSTLGGAIIARQAERDLGLDRDTGCGYFLCYGREVGQMWSAFGAMLLTRCRPADEDAIIVSAEHTFDHLRAWISAP